LPTEVQILGSRPAEIPVFVNFAQHEVCTVSLKLNFGLQEASTDAYEEEKLTSSRLSSTTDHGVWPLDFSNKNRLKKSSNVLISLML
jgi:hypothetical protein